MTVIAGVDGCRAGWLCICKETETGNIGHQVHASFQSLINQNPFPKVIAIDIPIGLTDAGQRECDTQARKLLKKPRSNSVFPAPIRPALKATIREEGRPPG